MSAGHLDKIYLILSQLCEVGILEVTCLRSREALRWKTALHWWMPSGWEGRWGLPGAFSFPQLGESPWLVWDTGFLFTTCQHLGSSSTWGFPCLGGGGCCLTYPELNFSVRLSLRPWGVSPPTSRLPALGPASLADKIQALALTHLHSHHQFSSLLKPPPPASAPPYS